MKVEKHKIKSKSNNSVWNRGTLFETEQF